MSESMSEELRQLYNVNVINKYNECLTHLNGLGELCGAVSGEYEAIAEDVNAVRDILQELTNAHIMHTPGCPNCETCSTKESETNTPPAEVESEPVSIMAMDFEYLEEEGTIRGVIYDTETEAIQEVGEWFEHPEDLPPALTCIKILRQMADQLERKGNLAGLN